MHIRPEFSHLNQIPYNSEVVTSAHPTTDMSEYNAAQKEKIMLFEIEWKDKLEAEGIAVPSSVITQCSEVSMFLNMNEGDHMLGKLIDIVKGTYTASSSHQVNSIVMSKKMDETLESFQDKLEKLDTYISSLQETSPRKQIKTAKKGKNKAPKITIVEMGEMQDTTKGGKITEERDSSIYNASTSQEELHSHVGIGGTEQDPIVVEETNKYAGIPRDSDAARGIRDSIRSYYMDKTFAALSEKDQTAILRYHGSSILMLGDNWQDDPELYAAVHDITNKTTVMICLDKANAGEVDLDILTGAQGEFLSAIKEYGVLYGDWEIELSNETGIPQIRMKNVGNSMTT